MYISKWDTGANRNVSFRMVTVCGWELAGCISLNQINHSSKNTSIGYWLGAEFQGRGIMTSACRALIDYAFKDLHLNRVEIRAAVGNHKSRAVPERMGFVQEGIVRQAEWINDHFVDHVIYGMLKEDWNNLEEGI